MPSCVVPVPVMVPVAESDIESLIFIPLLAAMEEEPACVLP